MRDKSIKDHPLDDFIRKLILEKATEWIKDSNGSFQDNLQALRDVIHLADRYTEMRIELFNLKEMEKLLFKIFEQYEDKEYIDFGYPTHTPLPEHSDFFIAVSRVGHIGSSDFKLAVVKQEGRKDNVEVLERKYVYEVNCCKRLISDMLYCIEKIEKETTYFAEKYERHFSELLEEKDHPNLSEEAGNLFKDFTNKPFDKVRSELKNLVKDKPSEWVTQCAPETDIEQKTLE
jgi:hypothetical protein